MMQYLLALLIAIIFILSSHPSLGQRSSPRVLAFYSTDVEADHVAFAEQALEFYAATAKRDNFVFSSTTNWDDLNSANLSQYQVVLWLNGSPALKPQRAAFEDYMNHGGAWLGFHAAGYNDKDTGWPWYVTFLGGAVFYGNSWPPLPAKLLVDDRTSPVTRRVPPILMSPANEWYSWSPNPRTNKDVKVLLTLSPVNYPLGLKDILTGGDVPVVWTNTKYKMLYMNMGHGDKIFTEENQNLMFEDALLWLGGRSESIPLRK